MSTYDDAMDTSSDKGKGKATDDSMATDTIEEPLDDESSEEEEELADEHAVPAAEVEEDEFEEIDTGNIISGGRTRGKVIDYSQVDQTGLEPEDDDDDDGEFQEKSETATHHHDTDRMEQ